MFQYLHRSSKLRLMVCLTLLLLLAASFSTQAAGIVATDFDGLARSNATVLTETPDVSGAVGLNHYMQVVDLQIGMWDKITYTPTVDTPTDLPTFFSGVGNAICDDAANFYGQPQILFDHMSQRWFVTAVAYHNIDNGPYYLCTAVSQTAEPTLTASDWFQYELLIHSDYLPDQHKLGLWPDGIYMAANLIDTWNNGLHNTPKGVVALAINRDDLVAGSLSPDTQKFTLNESTGYSRLLPSNLLGDPPPPGTPNYFAAVQAPNRFLTWEFRVDWNNPNNSSFNGPKITTVNTFTPRVGFQAVQPGANSEKLDVNASQLMAPLQYRYVTNGQVAPALWANHTIANGATTGVRWYEFRNLSGSSLIVQQQSVVSNPADASYRWLGSMAVDGQGNMAIAYSKSSNSLYPSIYQAGRLSTDPLGQLQPEMALFSGSGSQAIHGTEGPWGHASSMALDPYDQCHFWYTNQYYDANDSVNWRTRIIKFSLVDCAPLNPGVIRRVSLDSNNQEAFGGGSGIYSTDISADGRFVVFDSEGVNLVSGDTNGHADVFLRDRDVDQDGIFDEVGAVSTTRVSVSSSGVQGNADSGTGVTGDFGGTNLSISADGRYIAFASAANNLVTGDNNGTTDVFVRDRLLGLTVRVSIASSGVQGNAVSDQPSLSADGRFVAFRSFANNMSETGDTNAVSDIFLHDRDTDNDGLYDEPGAIRTRRISYNFTAGAQGNGHAYTPSVVPSADGRFVAFAANASNLAAADANGFTDIFVYDRNQDGDLFFDEPGDEAVFLVSFDSIGGAAANGRSYHPSIAANGLIAFASEATNLVNGAPTNGFSHIFIAPARPPAGQGVALLSKALNGPEGNRSSYRPHISADAAFVTFESEASNLLPGDSNGLRDIYGVELASGVVTRSSFSTLGLDSNGASFWPAVSNGGASIAYASNALNLVGNDTNNLRDVFVHNREETPPQGPTLRVHQEAISAVYAGEKVAVPLTYRSNSNTISSLAFALDLNNSCWTFDPTDSNNDGIPNDVAFNLPPNFLRTVTYDAQNLRLEITAYGYSNPPATLVDGNIVTVQLQAICQPAPGGSQFYSVKFSANPPASFGMVSGQNVPGETLNGSVEVLYNNAGDCNGDLSINAADISALILEIYDGDGNLPGNVTGGTFAGDPRGCNANGDGVVDSGDISKTILIIFNGFAAVVGDSANSGVIASANALNAGVTLTIPQMVTAVPGESVTLPVQFEPVGESISSMAFSIDYDESLLTLNETDANADGIPDAVTLNLPPAFTASVSVNTSDTDGEIDIVIYDFSLPFAAVPPGDLLSITFETANPSPGPLAEVGFSLHPLASFGNLQGQSVAGTAVPGSVLIGHFNHRLYLPVMQRP